MMSQGQGQLSRFRRGVFGLDSWDPLRKPGSAERHSSVNSEPSPSPRREKSQSPNINNNIKTSQMDEGRTQPVVNGAPTNAERPVMAKYSYMANANSPLGVELTMKQGDHLTLCSGVNELWWLARDANNKVGYVPASYLMLLDETTTGGLPWLQNKPVEPEQPEEKINNQPMTTAFGRPDPMTTAFGRPDASTKELVKPYQSAYNRQQVDEKKWHCELCNKTLNGPQPYKAHMNSKDHKAEEEYAREEGRL